ncbi:MAG: acyl carrier protein [Lachnospiraceae bacterium]|nr:acyl carrier protein [Lachnospiraceae bacterium]
MRETILNILKDIRPEFDFESSNNFIEDGFLDSFDVVTVISELELKYNIVIDGLAVIPENFESLDSICELVKKSGEK